MKKHNNKIKNNKNLKNKIIFEYLYIVLSLLIIYFLLPFLVKYMIGDNTYVTIDQTVAIAIKLGIIIFITLFIFFIANPIRILIVYKREYKYITPKSKKRLYIFVIVLPIFILLLMLLKIPISNFINKLKNENSNNAYTVSPKKYKLPIDFYNELKKRNLL